MTSSSWISYNLKYIIARTLRRQVSSDMFFLMMQAGLFRLTRNGAERTPDQCFAHWNNLLSGQKFKLDGASVMEIGSGRYARFGVHLLAAGAADVTLIDLYATPLDDPAHRSTLEKDCTSIGFRFSDIQDKLEVIRGDVIDLQLCRLMGQKDLVISEAMLEHVKDPHQVLARCLEWLKPGGVTCHIIDLRDHYFRYPFEMLTFSDHTWETWLNPKGGFHLNRWRVPDYLCAMNEVGFVNVGYEFLVRDPDGLEKVLPRLDRKFSDIAKDVLSVQVMILYGEKPP